MQRATQPLLADMQSIFFDWMAFCLFILYDCFLTACYSKSSDDSRRNSRWNDTNPAVNPAGSGAGKINPIIISTWRKPTGRHVKHRDTHCCGPNHTHSATSETHSGCGHFHSKPVHRFCGSKEHYNQWSADNNLTNCCFATCGSVAATNCDIRHQGSGSSADPAANIASTGSSSL